MSLSAPVQSEAVRSASRSAAWRARIQRGVLSPWMQPALIVAGLVPFAWLWVAALTDQLGPNPAEALIRATGDWALRFLCATLAITPLRITLGLPALARLRRTLGLFVAFYALWHLLTYAWFDMGLDLPLILADVAKRPFILVGMVAFALLVPMAATSLNAAIRWMGPVRWRVLHSAIFGIAFLVLLHFFWMRAGKNDFAEVFLYAGVLTVLIGWRILRAYWPRRTAV
jgi:sulfoxide reductase heme-binding subunit YedZ